MRHFSEGLGEFAKDHKWLLTLIAVASGVGTFVLTNPIVGLAFSTGLLTIMWGAAVYSLSNQSGGAVSLPDEAQPSPDAGTTIGADAAEVARAAIDDSTEAGIADSRPLDEPTGAEPENTDLREMFDLAWAGDVAGARSKFKAVMAAVGDDERRRIEAAGQWLLVKAGDNAGLDRLRSLVEEQPSPDRDALQWYAQALELLGESETAARVLLEKSGAYSTEDRAAARLQAARILRANEQLAAAAAVVSELAVDETVSATHRADAWTVVAQAKAEGSPAGAMLAYEKAVQLDPSNSGTRFDVAWLYMEHEFYALALHHFQVLERTNRASSGAINNLAVCEARLGMRSKAFEHYREAGNDGSALAYANLSHLLLDAGAFKEASEAIESGEKIDSSEARLVAARERLTQAEESEAKTYGEVRERSTAERIVMSAAVDRVGTPADFSAGVWQLSNGATVEMQANGDRVEGVDEKGDWRLTVSRSDDVYLATVRPGTYASEVQGFMFMSSPDMATFLFPSRPNVPSPLRADRASFDSAATHPGELD